MKKLLLILFLFVSSIAVAQHQYTTYVTASGTDTYAVTISVPTITNYSTKRIHLRFANANTGASTLNVTPSGASALGAVAIRAWDGDSWEPLVGGEIVAGIDYVVVYSGSYFELYASLPGSGATVSTYTIETITGTGPHTITDADNGKIFLYTNALGCSVLLGDGITEGISFTAVRATGAGNIEFQADGTATLHTVGGELIIEVDEGWASWVMFPSDEWRGTGVLGPSSSGAVSSVFGRTGAVVAVAGDYDGTEITNTPAGNIAATTTQAAINELDTEKQPLDSDLTTIAGLAPSNDDFLQRKAGAWANRTIAQVKSDLGLSGTNTGDQTITLTGDVTGSGTGSFATTLATVNSNTGTFGSATQASQITVNAKGLITAAAAVTITPAIGSITGLGTGVATALAINTGSAGAVQLNNLTQGNFLVGNSSNIATAYRLGYVTPEMYGAVRDGSTDDATAITNAFASGLPVYFGPGNYRIASGISIPAGATAYGFGEMTVISTVQTTINMFTLNGRATITGIKFLGSDLSGQVGISVVDVISTGTKVGNVLENCRFVDLRYGHSLATVYSSNFEGAIQATNCQFISCVIGVWLQAGAEYNKYMNCTFIGNTTGVRSDAGNNTFSGGQITNNTTGVQSNTGSNAGKNIFNGIHINHNTTAVLFSGITITTQFNACEFISASKLDITSSNVTFKSCYFNDTSSQSWSFTNGTSLVSIQNCTFGMTSANQPTVTQSGTAVNFLNNYFESGVVPTYAQGITHGAVTQTPFAATGTYTNYTQNGSLTASSGTSQSYIGYNMTPTYNTTSTFTGTAAGFRYAATRTSVTGLSEYPIITNGGLHGIGTLTPTETLHVVGRGTTSSTYNALFQNSTPSNVFAIRDDGATQYGSAGSRPSIYASAGTSTVSNSGASLTINASNANANSVLINQGLTQFANILALGGSFTNSSGTQSATLFKISTTINNTSTYAGTVIDLDINNTETSMTGTTHYGILNRSTTALNGLGTATPTERLEVNGNIKVSGNVTLSTAGNGVYIKEGTNATMGVATLSAGTVTVNTTKVTANSRIFITVQSLGTVAIPMAVAVTGRSAGTSFTITSADGTDTSVVAWHILEPAP